MSPSRLDALSAENFLLFFLLEIDNFMIKSISIEKKQSRYKLPFIRSKS